MQRLVGIASRGYAATCEQSTEAVPGARQRLGQRFCSGLLVSQRGNALHTEFMAKADSGGGLLEYVADGPQLANVVKISRVGGSYYLAVSFAKTQGTLQTRCSATYAEPCSEQNAEAYLGISASAIAGSASTQQRLERMTSIVNQEAPYGDSATGFQVLIYDHTWRCVAELEAADFTCPQIPGDAAIAAMEAAVAAGGDWVSFPGQRAFVFHVSALGTEFRLVAPVADAHAPPLCGSTGDDECPAHASCTSGRCACSPGYKASFVAGSGALPPSTMACEDVRGLDCSGTMGTAGCIDCPAGFYCPDGFPIFCPLGKYCPEGSRSPSLCPPGSVTLQPQSVSAATCTNCTTGMKWDPASETGRSACSPGFFSGSTGALECTSCPVGSWASISGSSVCVQCEGDLTTMYAGSSAASLCVCPEGSYMPLTVAQGEPSCQSCPVGMECAAGSDQRNALAGYSGPYPLVLPGHWASVEEPLSVYKCADEDEMACPGGLPEQCALHMKGRVCAQCEQDYSLRDGVCSACTDVATSQLLFPVLPFILGPAVISLMYSRSGDPYERWGNLRNGLIISCTLLLNHYQILALIGGGNINYPTTMSDSFHVWGHANDFMMLFQASCAGFGDFKTSFILRVFSPLMGLGITVLTYAGSYVVGFKFQQLKMNKDRLFSIFMGLIYTFYIGIASLSLSLFRCYEHPNGETSLVEAPSVLCGSDAWAQVIAFAIFAILVYCIFVFAVFVWVLWVAPRRFHETSFQQRWKFILLKFRSDIWWWGIVFLLKGIAVNLPFIFFVEGTAQMYWVIMTLLVYSWGLAGFFPWRVLATNALEIVACGSLMMLAALSLYFTTKTPALEDTVSRTSVVVSFTPCILRTCRC